MHRSVSKSARYRICRFLLYLNGYYFVFSKAIAKLTHLSLLKIPFQSLNYRLNIKYSHFKLFPFFQTSIRQSINFNQPLFFLSPSPYVPRLNIPSIYIFE